MKAKVRFKDGAMPPCSPSLSSGMRPEHHVAISTPLFVILLSNVIYTITTPDLTEERDMIV